MQVQIKPHGTFQASKLGPGYISHSYSGNLYIVMSASGPEQRLNCVGKKAQTVHATETASTTPAFTTKLGIGRPQVPTEQVTWLPAQGWNGTTRPRWAQDEVVGHER